MRDAEPEQRGREPRRGSVEDRSSESGSSEGGATEGGSATNGIVEDGTADAGTAGAGTAGVGNAVGIVDDRTGEVRTAANRSAPYGSAEALRRRLYAPGAGQADVASYLRAARPSGTTTTTRQSVPSVRSLEVSGSQGALPAAPALAEGAPVPAGNRIRIALFAGGVVVVGALAAGLLAERVASAPGPAAAPASASTPSALPRSLATRDPGDTVLPVDRSVQPSLAVDEADRRGFLARMADGRDAGVLGWLDAHPAAARTALPASGRSIAVETTATGTATIALEAAEADRFDGGGRIAVVLTTDRDAALRWAAARLVLHPDRTIHLAPVVTAGGAQVAGVPSVRSRPFVAGERPLRLIVQAPPGVVWDAVVVLDGASS